VKAMFLRVGRGKGEKKSEGRGQLTTSEQEEELKNELTKVFRKACRAG